MNDQLEVVNVQEENKLDILLDSSYPLLQKLREDAPGTYKHSQALESMIEGVSIDIGLDVTAMRVVALYHDIGKIYNAEFFCENALDDGDDPHTDLDPWVSTQIITRHVSDSVNILINDSNFPRDLIEVISQHHGTNVTKYFLSKSKSDDHDRYRYKCTKPSCVESAVLMICDSIEATSRSMFQSGNLDPKDLIDNTIAELIDNGQLDNVTIKLGSLKKIKIALAKELCGSYQKRVAYPVTIEESKEDKE